MCENITSNFDQFVILLAITGTIYTTQKIYEKLKFLNSKTVEIFNYVSSQNLQIEKIKEDIF